ncbi:MAG TPA: hypothetical protein VLH59_05505 [Ignavibacteriaceae bacterium]|nr:hypothetical protein [Ignavibacteriaceae bacterium]
MQVQKKNFAVKMELTYRDKNQTRQEEEIFSNTLISITVEKDLINILDIYRR